MVLGKEIPIYLTTTEGLRGLSPMPTMVLSCLKRAVDLRSSTDMYTSTVGLDGTIFQTKQRLEQNTPDLTFATFSHRKLNHKLQWWVWRRWFIAGTYSSCWLLGDRLTDGYLAAWYGLQIRYVSPKLFIHNSCSIFNHHRRTTHIEPKNNMPHQHLKNMFMPGQGECNNTLFILFAAFGASSYWEPNKQPNQQQGCPPPHPTKSGTPKKAHETLRPNEPRKKKKKTLTFHCAGCLIGTFIYNG